MEKLHRKKKAISLASIFSAAAAACALVAMPVSAAQTASANTGTYGTMTGTSNVSQIGGTKSYTGGSTSIADVAPYVYVVSSISPSSGKIISCYSLQRNTTYAQTGAYTTYHASVTSTHKVYNLSITWTLYTGTSS